MESHERQHAAPRTELRLSFDEDGHDHIARTRMNGNLGDLGKSGSSNAPEQLHLPRVTATSQNLLRRVSWTKLLFSPRSFC